MVCLVQMMLIFEHNELDENQPNHYKWGFLYYDPADHRGIVPKRVAWMGWTFNFASPFTYLIILAVIGFVLLMKYFF